MFKTGLVLVPMILSGCVFFDPDSILQYPPNKLPRDHIVLGPAAATYFPNGWVSCGGRMYPQFKNGLDELKRDAVGKYGKRVNGLVGIRQEKELDKRLRCSCLHSYGTTRISYNVEPGSVEAMSRTCQQCKPGERFKIGDYCRYLIQSSGTAIYVPGAVKKDKTKTGQAQGGSPGGAAQGQDQAVEDGQDSSFNVIYHGDDCRVRAGPSRSHEVIGVAEADVAYPMYARQGKWRRIRIDKGKLGWAGCNDAEEIRVEAVGGQDEPVSGEGGETGESIPRSLIDNMEIEIAYAYTGIISAADFYTVGDWNLTGSEFPVSTRGTGSLIGVSLGIKWFPLSEINVGLAPALRLEISGAELGIDWVDQSGTPIDSSSVQVTFGASCGYKLRIDRDIFRREKDLLGPGKNIHFIPEIGIGFTYFKSTPEGDELNDDSFTLMAPAVLFRGAFEVDVSQIVALYFAFQFHVTFAWQATRSFDNRDSVSGDTSGGAHLWKFVTGITF